MNNPTWIICPVLNNLPMTMDAIGDFLDQTVPTRVLVINQGSDDATREALERQAELLPDKLYIWSHCPPLPSLAASWNRGLDMVWEAGGDKALVLNNDTRVPRDLIKGLTYVFDYEPSALFVSAVAVAQEQFDPARGIGELVAGFFQPDDTARLSKGGPDFSCYMISKAGHQKYRFDESFIPLFCEDLDTHRRYMLGGDGDKIFSVNLPYLHLASQTLKRMDPEQRAKKDRQIDRCRAYYEKKWGGPVNQETFYQPFGEPVPEHLLKYFKTSGPATPELQAYWQSQ